jgi:hypothetical protein
MYKIEKSNIPIVWLDTSVITNITKYKKSPDKLEVKQRSRIEKLYSQVYEYGRAGKIICPLAEQEGEVWIGRDAWLDTINELSLGIECVALKEIQDRQLLKAMEGYVNEKPLITLSYLDAFYDDPVIELKETLQKPYYITVNNDIFLGADYRRESNVQTLKLLNDQREKNVKKGVSYKEQLTCEKEGEFTQVVKMVNELAAGHVIDERDEFNKFGAMLNLGKQIHGWELIKRKGDDFEGLIAFHKSNYKKECPYEKISCALYAKIMIDPQPIKSGDTMDISHISSLMPFSDLFITDKHWSVFLNREGYGREYNTCIAYIGDTEKIDKFFSEIV